MTGPARNRPLLRAGLGLLVGFVGSLAIITVVEHSSEVDSDDGRFELGRPDFEEYCAREAGMRALQIGNDALGWRCAGAPNQVWGVRDIDTNDLCRWQYDPTAYAVMVDPSDVDGWRCVRDR